MVCTLQEASYERLKRLSKFIDMNDFLHVACPYDPRTASSSASLPTNRVLPRPARACRESTRVVAPTVSTPVGLVEETENPGNLDEVEGELVRETQQYGSSGSFDQYGSQLPPVGRDSPATESPRNDTEVNAEVNLSFQPPEIDGIMGDLVGDSDEEPTDDQDPIVEPSSPVQDPIIITLSDSDDEDGNGSTRTKGTFLQDVEEHVPLTTVARDVCSMAADVVVEDIDDSDFRNAAGKAPPLDVVVPKGEGEWWTIREMRKKKKAEEKLASQLKMEKLQLELERLRSLEVQGLLVASGSSAPFSADDVVHSPELSTRKGANVSLTFAIPQQSSEAPTPSMSDVQVPLVSKSISESVDCQTGSEEDLLRFSFEPDMATTPSLLQVASFPVAVGNSATLEESVPGLASDPVRNGVVRPDVPAEEDVYSLEVGLPHPEEGELQEISLNQVFPNSEIS